MKVKYSYPQRSEKWNDSIIKKKLFELQKNKLIGIDHFEIGGILIKSQ